MILALIFKVAFELFSFKKRVKNSKVNSDYFLTYMFNLSVKDITTALNSLNSKKDTEYIFKLYLLNLFRYLYKINEDDDLSLNSKSWLLDNRTNLTQEKLNEILINNVTYLKKDSNFLQYMSHKRLYVPVNKFSYDNEDYMNLVKNHLNNVQLELSNDFS